MPRSFPGGAAIASLLLLAALMAAPAVPVPAAPSDGSLCFRDLSAASGGPVDFGDVLSTVEKTTAAWVDVDGDTWDDLVVLTGVGRPFAYFLNRPDGGGGRALVPAPAGNGLDTGAAFTNDGASITAGDVDGDGDEDLFVGCGWNAGIASGENILLLNDGEGRFTDVTAEVGLLDGDNTTAACTFFDMDLDGDLDLLFCNTDFPITGKDGDGVAHLYRNTLRETGELRFIDETELRGVIEDGKAVWQASAFDYDLDGDTDLLITHDILGPAQLFANDGGGFFTDVTAVSGSGPGTREDPTTFGDDSRNAMGVAVGDVENDGDLDVYISNLKYNPLYVSNGDGTFRELAGDRGCSGGRVTWGVLFQDFDLDGYLDLHVAAGDTWRSARPEVRPFLYHNLGDGSFEEVFWTSGMRHDPPNHREAGTAASDFDGDGRVDLVVCRANRFAPASPYLYRNETDTAGRHWITVTARGNGVTGNTSSIGAIIRVVPRDADGVAIPGLTQVRNVVASESRAARSSLSQTFGLGPDAAVVDVEIVWPRAGTLDARTERFPGLAVDRRIVLEDGNRPTPWRLDPTATAEVIGGAAVTVVAAGSGQDAGLARCELASPPEWVSLGPFANGVWPVFLTPPVVQVETESAVTLVSRLPGSSEVFSRQQLTVNVLPAPYVERARPMARATRLRLVGRNFPRRACQVFVDGLRSPRVYVRRRHKEADGQGTRLVAVLPGSLRRGFRSKPHVIRVVDEETGRASPPFEFEARR